MSPFTTAQRGILLMENQLSACLTEELVLMCKALESRGMSVVLQEMAGMAFNPLDRTWTLESTTSVNYIACFKRM